jgi:hypothetical protein
MADPRHRDKAGPLVLRVESDKFLVPSDVAGRIENMVVTAEGTMRSTPGFCPWLPDYVSWPGAPGNSSTPRTTKPTIYGDYSHGICHARINSRDILLLQTNDQLWVFRGASRDWEALVVPSGATAIQLNQTLLYGDDVAWATQFEVMPNGIVIIPYRGRALFYDGVCIAPLGYSRAPAPPEGSGPATPSDGGHPSVAQAVSARTHPNTVGYAHDRNPNEPWRSDNPRTGGQPEESFQTSMHPSFGFGRVGTMSKEHVSMEFETIGATRDYTRYGSSAGYLEAGQYRAATQWVDRWGNLSPLSGPSADVSFLRQTAHPHKVARTANTTEDPYPTEYLLKHLLWTGIDPGPTRTLGRILYRTKDLQNAGTDKFYEVPADAMTTTTGFATLNDNSNTIWPDNTPDAWLLREAQDVISFPSDAAFARKAFGRLFILTHQGQLRASMPGRWGTFLRDDVWYPDLEGQEIRGMWAHASGLLVFSETSTFLLAPSDSSGEFVLRRIHTSLGCVAPNSCATLQDGRAVWLARDGFVAWDGEMLVVISDDKATTLRGINKARRVQSVAVVDPTSGEYRCFLPLDGADSNTLALVYSSGDGWRTYRVGVYPTDICVTQDHRQYLLAVGNTVLGDNGVWLLDHAVTGWDIIEPQAIFETAWIEARASRTRKSARSISFWLRETSSQNAKITVFRDWKLTNGEVYSGQPELEPFALIPPDDIPSMWGVTAWDAEGAVWERRRPFWRRYDIDVASCEVYRVRIEASPATSSSPRGLEVIGLTVEDNPKGDSGLRTPR